MSCLNVRHPHIVANPPSSDLSSDGDTDGCTDVPIRPYTNHRQSAQEEGPTSEVTGTPTDKTDSDSLGFEDSSSEVAFLTTRISWRGCRIVPFALVLQRTGEVFFSKFEFAGECESCSNAVDSDETVECENVRTRDISEEILDHKENTECKLWKQFPQEEQLKLLKVGPKCGSKVSGKRQCWKKLNDLLGAFDFHYLEPAPVRAVVFPVSRQNPGQGHSSNSQKDSDESSPSPPGERQWPPESIYGLPWMTFRQELHRLGTFLGMPPNSPVSSLRLAQVGFLRLPEGFIVCYFCGLRRDVWNAGECPAAVHREMRPDCPMSAGAPCDNEPVDTPTAEQLEELMQTWSLSGPPLLPGGDPEQRATANAAVPPPSQGNLAGASQTTNSHPSGSAAQASIAADSDPTAATPVSNQNVGSGSNQASSPQQPRLGLLGGSASSANLPHAPIFDGTAQPVVPASTTDTRSTSSSEARSGQQVVTYQQLGIVTEAPKRPDMAMINSRVGTFRNWPSNSSHTPLELSEAGFYYAGYADCGRCFFCGGGLKNWEPADNPWVEHARWFPKCSYVRQCQGQDFIDIIQELNEANRQQISLNQVREEINRRRADGERIQEPVVDPAILAALELGYSQEAVDAVLQRLQREGHQLTAARLLDGLQADGSLAAGGADAIAAISDTELGEIDQLATENSEIRQQRMCKICLDKEVCIVFLPCGHLVCCAECSPALRHCPMCRQRVKGRVRAFPT